MLAIDNQEMQTKMTNHVSIIRFAKLSTAVRKPVVLCTTGGHVK